ncbi:MAG: hypothetical protein WAN12_01710 [Candidatus Acidiferrum sp.]
MKINLRQEIAMWVLGLIWMSGRLYEHAQLYYHLNGLDLRAVWSAYPSDVVWSLLATGVNDFSWLIPMCLIVFSLRDRKKPN